MHGKRGRSLAGVGGALAVLGSIGACLSWEGTANGQGRPAPAGAEAHGDAVAPRGQRPTLTLTDTVSQHGITWKFSEPARVGQFVNGDYYVVGPVTITSITPRPENGRNGW